MKTATKPHWAIVDGGTLGMTTALRLAQAGRQDLVRGSRSGGYARTLGQLQQHLVRSGVELRTGHAVQEVVATDDGRVVITVRKRDAHPDYES